MFIDKELEKIVNDNAGIFAKRDQKIKDIDKDVSVLETYLTMAGYDSYLTYTIGGDHHNDIVFPYGYISISDYRVCFQEKRGDKHKYFSELDNNTKLTLFPYLKLLVKSLFGILKKQIGDDVHE